MWLQIQGQRHLVLNKQFVGAFFTSVDEVIADENFLAWYFQNDREKAMAWEQWLAQNPASQLLADEAVAMLNELSLLREAPLGNEQTAAAWQRLAGAINTGEAPIVRPMRRWWIRAAAAAVLVLAVSLVWVNLRNNKTTLNTSYGVVEQYQLPDGSEVILNARSEVKLNRQWTAGEDREVWVRGEAFFHVRKTAAKNRFVVHTTNMDIVVTGTKFNVVNRDDESSVLLTEGSVTLLTKDGRELQMKPGEFVKIENDKPEKANVSEEKVLAWKQSKLVFDKTPMSEVANIITRHYGVKVRFADPLLAKKEIGGIMSNDNLDLLMRSLEALGEFRITKTGDEILISRPL